MAILMLINLKGGVAKTTSAVAIAECLAVQGHKTLLIDADHQCMAGELLLGEAGQTKAMKQKGTLYHLMAQMLDAEFDPSRFPWFVSCAASNMGRSPKNLSVLPCSIMMDDFSTNMAKARKGYQSTAEFSRALDGRKRQMRRWLTEEYKFTVIDCPPSLALQVKILLSVADAYIIPAIPEPLSVRGSLYLLQRLKSHQFKIAGLGTLWSLFRKQNPMHSRFIEQTAEGVPPFDQLPRPFATVIPNAAKIAEATETGQYLKTFAQRYSSEFGKLFQELCHEIVERAQGMERANIDPAKEQEIPEESDAIPV